MGLTLPSTDDRVVTVLGGGVLGRRIACAWAASGFDVVIRDPSAEQRIAAVHYCETSFPQYAADHSPRDSVTATEDLAAAVASAWLVIEAVPEKLPFKVSTLAELEALAPADALLCSNSSSYNSREMLGGLRRPEETARRVLNMHYYMPPGNRVVELMTCGRTDDGVFSFLAEKLRAIGMHPYVARKESTGLIFNRLWAAIKREVLTILAEGVSTPEEVDRLWLEVWGGNERGPVAMMDAVGLDTVSFIEQHYIAERGLPSTPVDFLKTYVDEGRLGTKSARGGLLPPGGGGGADATASGSSPGGAGHDDLHAPLLYFLDIGLAAPDPRDALRAGRVLVGASDERPLKPLVRDQHAPDGIDVALAAGKLFWTGMGVPGRDEGSVWHANLDGQRRAPAPPARPRRRQHAEAARRRRGARRAVLCGPRRACACSAARSTAPRWRRSSRPATGATRRTSRTGRAGASASPCRRRRAPFTGRKRARARAARAGSCARGWSFGRARRRRPGRTWRCCCAGLPEPIDLDIDEAGGHLYWTDRGELPIGNSINRVKLEGLQPLREEEGAGSVPGRDYELLARNMHEAIGIKLDLRNRHIYTTDLGGAVYRFGMDGTDKKRLYEGAGAFAGIALAYV